MNSTRVLVIVLIIFGYLSESASGCVINKKTGECYPKVHSSQVNSDLEIPNCAETSNEVEDYDFQDMQQKVCPAGEYYCRLFKTCIPHHEDCSW